MRSLLVLTLVAVLLVLLGVAYDRYSTPRLQPVAKEEMGHRDKAPKVAFRDMHGKSFTLNEVKSAYVLVNFWATWCTPCKQEFPLLAELAEKNRDRLTVIAISVDDESARLDDYLAQFDARTRKRLGASNILIIHDSDQAIAHAYQSYRYPESYLVGPDRTIERKIVGALQPEDKLLD